MRSSSQWIRAAFFFALFAFCLAPLAPTHAADAAKPPLIFQHVTISASSDVTEACFHFSQALDSRAEAHYGDYVAVEPGLTPSLHASGSDLCLGGLAYGTDYTVTLRKGLPGKSGARTAADETVPVTLGDRVPSSPSPATVSSCRGPKAKASRSKQSTSAASKSTCCG